MSISGETFIMFNIMTMQRILENRLLPKILLGLFGLLYLAIIGRMYLSAKYNNVIIENRNLVVSRVHRIDSYMHSRFMMLNLLSTDNKIKSLNPELMQQELTEVADMLGFLNIAVFDTNGNLISDAKKIHPPKAVIDNSFIKAAQGQAVVSGRLVPSSDAEPRIGLRVPVYDENKVVAVITAVISVQEIARLVDNGIMSKDKYFFIIDNWLQFIYHPNFQHVINKENLYNNKLLELYNRSAGCMFDYSPFDNKWKLFIFESLDESDWRVVISIPIVNFVELFLKNIASDLFIMFLLIFAVLLIFQLILQVKRHDEDIENLKLERLTSVNQFAAGIAHEIRNPLTSIKGFIQLMEQKKDQIIPTHYVEIIMAEISQIENLIGEYQKLAKPAKPLNFCLININQLLHSVILLMGSQALNKSIKLSYVQNSTEVYVSGNEDQLKQIFINIIKNAFEAVNNGGSVKVSIDSSNYAVITIEDDGQGISPSILKKIDLPFFTTKTSRLGLGLSVCYNFIQNHCGKIRFTSKEGQGTKVTIELPLAKKML